MGSPNRTDSLLRTLEWGVALAATLVVVYLHWVFLWDAGGLWRDEANSVDLAAFPSFDALWDDLRHDTFPPLLTLVLRAWMELLGDSDLALRFFGFLVGLGSLAAFWLAARRLGGSVPLLPLALVGTSSLLLRAEDSLRPHGLAALLMLLTLVFLWDVCLAPGRWNVLAAAACAVLSVQTAYNNAPLLLALCLAGAVVALARGGRRRAALVLGIGLLAALSLVPYLSRLQAARDWTPLLGAPPQEGQRIGMAFDHAAGGSFGVGLWVALWLLAVVAAAVILRLRGRFSDGERDLAGFALGVLVAAPLGFVLFVKYSQFSCKPWYYLSVLGMVAVALETVLGALLRPAPLRALRLLGVAALVGLGFFAALPQVAARQTNVDLIAQILNEEAETDDLVLVNPWFDAISLQRYYRGKAPLQSLPPLSDLTTHRYDLLKEAMCTARPVAPVLAEVEARLKAGRRVWYVGAWPPGGLGDFSEYPPAPSGPDPWDASKYQRQWSHQLGALLVRNDPQVLLATPEFPGWKNQYEWPDLVLIQGRGKSGP